MLTLVIALMIFGLPALAFLCGTVYDLGKTAGRSSVERDAIAMGYGTYIVTGDSHEFRWYASPDDDDDDDDDDSDLEGPTMSGEVGDCFREVRV